MALSPGLARALEAAEIEAAAAVKHRWVRRLLSFMQAIDPPLSSLELSVGLDLDPPPPMTAQGPKRPRITTVGRWLSEAPRNLRHVPDARVEQLFDKLEAGTAVACAGRERGLDGLRSLVFCEPWEVARLGPDLDVIHVRSRASSGAEAVVAAEPPLDFSGGATIVPPRPSTPEATPAIPSVATARREPPRAHIGPWSGPALGLGAMRLATAGHPPSDVGLAVLRHALDAGLRLIDTADAYGVDQKDMHAGERLVRHALAGWSSADRDQVLVATKAGLVRPGGRWLPDGRPEHLRAACEGSLQALGVDVLPLWQLHVRDRRVPWEDSLGAMASLYKEGKVRHLGLCNVTAEDLHTALRLLPAGSLVAVQNGLSPFEAAGGNEVLALAKLHRLAFLAHSPLGGHRGAGRITKRPVFYSIADKHGVTPQAVVLAWLMTLGDNVVPLFGATRAESVDGSVQALTLVLDEADRAALDAAFPKAASLRQQAPPPAPEPDSDRMVELVSEPVGPPGPSPEVVIIMGIPGAGKSSLVQPYLDAGYLRLNRDERGGKLDGLIAPLRNALQSSSRRVVLDNTYPTRRQRAPVIEAAREAGVPVRCLWLDTPLDEARWNVARRIIESQGRLLGPDEITALGREDAGTIPPRAQAHWLQAFEPPRPSEGFERVERRPFVRRPEASATQRGLLLDVDGTLRKTRSGEPYPRSAGDVVLLPRRREILARWRADGWRLFFVSNQSGIHSGRVSRRVVDEAFHRTIDLLGLPIDEVAYCPHQAFPIACFCRKPMPGLVTWLALRHKLDRSSLTLVGDQPADVELARAVQARYVAADTFFGR